MKRLIKSLTLWAFLFATSVSAWGQATPSTEGRDFWVTFLRAADDTPTELKLTISAREACDVKIENTNAGYTFSQSVLDNSCTELVMNRANCYSSTNETATYTALHVTSTKDISLFAGNYRDKSFDATNVLPTSALLDDYLIQTYPPSDHENKPQGSHFAIIAVEDGQTVVDYDLTTKTAGGKTGSQSVTLKKGQVWYVWTGKNAGDEADLSGTAVRARNGKKIAVFQGCPHTNIPYTVRDRDHIISQAMPTAYWGTEFGITASRKHRRDIVAVMAINDGTEVYINDQDGEKQLIHRFNFREDKKRYITFEIGEYEAYCADNEGQSPTHGQLPPPQVVDSSCYLTTSCPAGVHLFMVSNRYDNAVPKVSSDTLVSDPAMLWVSPLEQVIKEINFATYKTAQVKFHFMNIITATSNVPNMTWNGGGISEYFHPLMGNSDYSYARIEIPHGSHNLKGVGGFLAHVYGYGERESYAYSCGSSTVARSISLNDMPLMIDNISSTPFCVNEEIEMKLNIGNNDYESVEWDFGDGTIYASGQGSSNEEKKMSTHTYKVPGWYDLRVTAVYVNSCTGKRHTETMTVSYQVLEKTYELVKGPHDCAPVGTTDVPPMRFDTIPTENCWKYYVNIVNPGVNTESYDTVVAYDTYYEPINGQTYPLNPDDPDDYHVDLELQLNGLNQYQCDSFIHRRLEIITCLHLEIPNDSGAHHSCHGKNLEVPYIYHKGDFGESSVLISGKAVAIRPDDGKFVIPTKELKPGYYSTTISIVDPNCNDTLKFPVDFTVYYSEEIFKYKFNNVLAVYNKAYNGGFDFVDYQWYKDGGKIEGANESVYHTEGQMPPGEYYVVLTDKSGMKLQSCSQQVDERDVTGQQSAAPAKKLLQNQRMYILKGDATYDIYGQRVR